MAIADFEEARKLQKETESDAEKWIKFTEADKEHTEKIATIMENAGSLAGKEYIDYLLAFLQGKKDVERPEQPKGQKRKQVCFHELTLEESKKLSKTLENSDMVYYFGVNSGPKVLVDSLYYSNVGLRIIEKLLEKNVKH